MKPRTIYKLLMAVMTPLFLSGQTFLFDNITPTWELEIANLSDDVGSATNHLQYGTDRKPSLIDGDYFYQISVQRVSGYPQGYNISKIDLKRGAVVWEYTYYTPTGQWDREQCARPRLEGDSLIIPIFKEEEKLTNFGNSWYTAYAGHLVLSAETGTVYRKELTDQSDTLNTLIRPPHGFSFSDYNTADLAYKDGIYTYRRMYSEDDREARKGYRVYKTYRLDQKGHLIDSLETKSPRGRFPWMDLLSYYKGGFMAAAAYGAEVPDQYPWNYDYVVEIIDAEGKLQKRGDFTEHYMQKMGLREGNEEELFFFSVLNDSLARYIRIDWEGEIKETFDGPGSQYGRLYDRERLLVGVRSEDSLKFLLSDGEGQLRELVDLHRSPDYPRTYVEEVYVTTDGGILLSICHEIKNTAKRRLVYQYYSMDQLGIEPLSTESVERDESSGIYPNPTQQYLHIDNPEGVKRIVISDIRGRKIATLEPGTTIDVGFLKEGTYILSLHYHTGVLSKKFVKL